MIRVPTSAYFLGHIVNAACSIVDMREAILAYFFFNPPGLGVILFVFLNFLIKLVGQIGTFKKP